MAYCKNVEIVFRKDEDIEKVIELCNEFVREGCCNGVVTNKVKDLLDQNLILAKMRGKIIGYAIVTIEQKKTTKGYSKKGDKSCFVEEIYVAKKYRCFGLGQKIFRFIENYAKNEDCSTVELCAVSKDYSKLLSFYIDKLGMAFWSANLFKKLT